MSRWKAVNGTRAAQSWTGLRACASQVFCSGFFKRVFRKVAAVSYKDPELSLSTTFLGDKTLDKALQLGATTVSTGNYIYSISFTFCFMKSYSTGYRTMGFKV